MCGIVGCIDPSLTDRDAAAARLEPSLAALARRGPDGRGVAAGPGWVLGHTRLAILDLSPRSSQPMTDGAGLWLALNGEIYNYRELRAELAAGGCRFRSTGDAEVLLQAWREWGPACLERLRGMFAFALLDEPARELVLARDRYGVKPLVWERRGAELRFASDLRALRALPGGARGVDPEAAYLYAALGYVPAPLTIHPGARKILPGSWLRARWTAGGVEDVVETRYWSMADLPTNGAAPAEGEDPAGEFERRAAESVAYRLRSDVPVGTLLSGGLDSTLVTALGRELADAELPSFTMGFSDPAFDERPFARAVADRLGGHHAEFAMDEGEVRDAWDSVWAAYDEPFADGSAVPTLALARRVAPRVKVALTGDGGDEILCGYPWHAALDRLDRGGLGGARFRRHHGLDPDAALDRAGVWAILRTGFSDPMRERLPVAAPETHAPLSEYFRAWSRDLAQVDDCVAWAGRMDLLTYLPDDLMVKADRAGMSVGLELREPLLDHALSAWCLRTPVEARYDRATETGKLLARRALERRMPRSLFDRPKQGFTPPLGAWMAGPLRESVEEALERLRGGDLEPLAVPSVEAPWSDDVLWRVVCYSEWTKQVAAEP